MKSKKGHLTRKERLELKKKESLKLIEKANALKNPLESLSNYVSYVTNDGLTYSLICYKVGDLPSDLLLWIFDLMERNMKSMYQQSSWGWNESSKRNELTESTAWYLIAFISDEPVGFSHFRYELDDNVEVLYCYELQLEPKATKQGLGSFMMNTLQAFASQSCMKKVVLTVFKHNNNARKFYKNLGFKIDKTSPPDWENLDYQILSK